MKKLTTILLIILPLVLWAHQDSFYTYKYDNVTVRFKTGSFYEEINNAKIIGKYTALLCNKLNYNEPVFLDFIHDYDHHYKGKSYSFLSIGSDKYNEVSYYVQSPDSLMKSKVYQMVPIDSIKSIKNIVKEVYTIPGINKKNGINLRQLGFHFDIKETMNLLFYAIGNKSVVQKETRQDTLSSYLSNMYYCFESISRNKIDKIKRTKIPFIDSVLTTKIYCEVDSNVRNQMHYSYFSQNGKYQLFASQNEKEIVLDTLNQIYSLNPHQFFPQVLFAFESPNQMRCYTLLSSEMSFSVMSFKDIEIKKSKKHQLTIDPFIHIKNINITWDGDDIYFIDFKNSFTITPEKRLIYLEKDDVIIDDFDEYIKSHRKVNKHK